MCTFQAREWIEHSLTAGINDSQFPNCFLAMVGVPEGSTVPSVLAGWNGSTSVSPGLSSVPQGRFERLSAFPGRF